MVPVKDEDFRFLCIPLVFPLLRVWKIVMDLLQINNHAVPFTIKALAVSKNVKVCYGPLSFYENSDIKTLVAIAVMW